MLWSQSMFLLEDSVLSNKWQTWNLDLPYTWQRDPVYVQFMEQRMESPVETHFAFLKNQLFIIFAFMINYWKWKFFIFGEKEYYFDEQRKKNFNFFILIEKSTK